MKKAIGDVREHIRNELLPRFLRARYRVGEDWSDVDLRVEFEELAKKESFQDADERKKEEMRKGLFK